MGFESEDVQADGILVEEELVDGWVAAALLD